MSNIPQKFCWQVEPELDHYQLDKKLGFHILAVKKRALFWFVLIVPEKSVVWMS